MSSRLRRRRRLTRPRRGFTVIEMIIAIIVMAIGVMGLAGTARYVAMQMGNGRTQTIAATFATKVADSLSARRCSSIVGGTQTKRGVTITWTVADSTKTKWVTESVQYKTKSGAKTVNYLTVIQCPD
jgi:prepilin-type N-terminal cleavage/methylation domain-containing protein